MSDNQPSDRKNSRASKHIGDFGEGLVSYTLIRKGFEVAVVDHVGADLIAEKEGKRIAVSVKTRTFRSASDESRGVVFDFAHIEKLEHFANRFALEPIVAQAVGIVDDCVIHLFMIRTEDIRKYLRRGKHGYCFGFKNAILPEVMSLPYIDYSSWSQENIAGELFPNSVKI